jgi:hypothetical protein
VSVTLTLAAVTRIDNQFPYESLLLFAATEPIGNPTTEIRSCAPRSDTPLFHNASSTTVQPDALPTIQIGDRILVSHAQVILTLFTDALSTAENIALNALCNSSSVNFEL